MGRWQKEIAFLQGLGKEIIVAWWGQETKADADIDELESLDQIAYISPTQFLAKGGIKLKAREISQAEYEERFAKPRLTKWLEAQLNGLGKHFEKGFGQHIPSEKKVDLNKPVEFNKGDRLTVITKAMGDGYKYILDQSETGTGKSHSLGQLDSEKGKVWLISQNHRNPSTPTWRDKPDLMPRHRGLIKDIERSEQVGFDYYRHVKEWETPDIPGNCDRAHLFNELREKGYSPDDWKDEGTNPICKTCPHFQQRVKNISLAKETFTRDGEREMGKGEGEKTNPLPLNLSPLPNPKGESLPKCIVSRGDGFGYLGERMKGIASPQPTRTHLDSMPQNHDLSKDLAVVDEPRESFKLVQKVQASLNDFDGVMAKLELEDEDVFNQLKPLRQALRPLLSGDEKLPYHGLGTSELLSLLSDTAKEIKALEVDLNLDAQSIFAEPDSINLADNLTDSESLKAVRKQWGHSAATARRYLRAEAYRETEKNIEALPSNWLTRLIEVLQTNQGTIRITPNKKLIITTPDYRHRDLLTRTIASIFLDATMSREQLAALLGVAPKEILVIKQKTKPVNNLQVIYVPMQGMKSRNYSESCIERIKAALEGIRKRHPRQKIKILGLKKFIEQLKQQHPEQADEFLGWWFNQNRGTNEAEGVPIMISLGSPTPNVGEVQDEYFTIHGSLDGFEEYYQGLINAEIIQVLGRQRSHRYPQQEFIHYLLLTDLDIQAIRKAGYQVSVVEPYHIHQQAATRRQLDKFRLIEFCKTYLKTKQELTQKAIADGLDVTQGWISKLFKGENLTWQGFKRIFQSLYKTYIGSGIFNSKDEEMAEVKSWLELHPVEGLTDAVELIRNCGWESFAEYLKTFSAEVQWLMLAQLAVIFLPELKFDESPPS